MKRRIVVAVATWVGIAFWVGFGVWAFVSPRSFFDAVATFPPYNRHFLHDVGAFQLGIGSALIAGLRWKDGLLAALAGSGVASVVHFVSHVLDRSLGGQDGDLLFLGLMAVVVGAGAVARAGRAPR